MNKNISIEIFPAEKSCEQGCPPCPLARKDAEITAVSVNEDVQETFSLLEKVFKKENVLYDIHLASRFNLIPAFRFPELVKMTRFTTEKNIRELKNTTLFSANVKAMLDRTGINPSTIGYSIVPSTPVVTEEEIRVIRAINSEISEWFFGEPSKEIEVTIRSNLIKLDVFEKTLAHVFAADLLHLRMLMSEFTRSYQHIAKIEEDFESRFYSQLYVGEKKKRTIRLMNRVMSAKKLSDAVRTTILQATMLMPRKEGSIVDFAIAPKGVMLVHSSIAINNPVLWVTHQDFRKYLAIEQKGVFRPRLFMERLMKENRSMYFLFMDKIKKGEFSEPFNFMKSYELAREKFRRETEKK